MEIDQKIRAALLNTDNDFFTIIENYSTQMGELFSKSLIWLIEKVKPIRTEILTLFISSTELYAVLKMDATEVDIKPFIKKALLKPTRVKALIYLKGKIYRVDCIYIDEFKKK